MIFHKKKERVVALKKISGTIRSPFPSIYFLSRPQKNIERDGEKRLSKKFAATLKQGINSLSPLSFFPSVYLRANLKKNIKKFHFLRLWERALSKPFPNLPSPPSASSFGTSYIQEEKNGSKKKIETYKKKENGGGESKLGVRRSNFKENVDILQSTPIYTEPSEKGKKAFLLPTSGKESTFGFAKQGQGNHKSEVGARVSLRNQRSLYANQSSYDFRTALKNRLIPREYSLETFHRSNQDTCLLHNPAVFEGDWVQSGDLLADCAASSGGELSLGKNILIAYMPWEGYNFEDAILISERLVFEDVYSSIHIERYDVEIRETKYGMEAITRNIPELNQKELEHLDSNGVAKLGSWIQEGDVLVGRVTPINKKVQSTYKNLLFTILQTKPESVRDSSLRAPRGMKGKIVNVQRLKKTVTLDTLPLLLKQKKDTSQSLSSYSPGPLSNSYPSLASFSPMVKKVGKQYHGNLPTFGKESIGGVVLLRKGILEEKKGKGSLTFLEKNNKKPKKVIKKKIPKTKNIIESELELEQSPLSTEAVPNLLKESESGPFLPVVSLSSKEKKESKGLSSLSPSLRSIGTEATMVSEAEGVASFPYYGKRSNTIVRGSSRTKAFATSCEAPQVKGKEVALLRKERVARSKDRKQVVKGSKKAVKTSKAVSPLVKEGQINIVYVYLAEKRRIQVGDKMAGRHGNKGIVSQVLPRQDMPFLANGTPIDMVLNPLGVPSRMNVGQIYECLLGLAAKYLGEHYKIFPFDEKYGPEASRSFVYSKLYEARKKTGSEWLFNPNCPGKTRLFDGRTGDPFDQSVTVGYAYMLKLVHLVDDKIHMRSTGPYSLVTQQPLRGRSKQGGQRLGEMEVWALEGYGAAFTLLEMLTIKSDDMTGRMTLWSNLILNKDLSIGTPESFKVLVCELQALCLDIGIFRVDSVGNLSEIESLTELP